MLFLRNLTRECVSGQAGKSLVIKGITPMLQIPRNAPTLRESRV